MDLRQLRDLLGEYKAGSWFVLNSSASGFAQDKPLHYRPFILIADWSTARPIAQTKPRSTTSRNGLPHDAHPRDHDPGCRINKPGCIVNVRWSVSSELVRSENYSCTEPDDSIMKRL